MYAIEEYRMKEQTQDFIGDIIKYLLILLLS